MRRNAVPQLHMREPEIAPVSSSNHLRPTLTILGFDYGGKRIGVAVGNTFTGDARALSIVGNGDNGVDWPRVDAIIRDWRPNLLLVGLPLMLDGSEQANSRTARAFAAELTERYKLEAHLVDERLSSVEASQRFADLRASGQARRKNAAELDAIAAQVIIETWLRQTPPT
jgi:putative Holliday junction resolvase